MSTKLAPAFHPFSFLAGLLAGVVSAAFGAATERGVAPVDVIEAVIPAEVRGLPLENPGVVFLVRVDETGGLVEHMPLAATHYKLIAAAVPVLTAASFQPALVAGRPVAATAEVAVTFYDPEQRAYQQGIGPLPYGHSATDGVISHFYWSEKQRVTFHRSKPAELDHPLAIAVTKVMLYQDSSGRPARGRCVVEYWVDAAGNPRFPRIVSSDNEAVSLSALLTLQQTKFVPPTHEGLPTYVQARQPMEFNTEPVLPAGPKSSG